MINTSRIYKRYVVRCNFLVRRGVQQPMNVPREGINRILAWKVFEFNSKGLYYIVRLQVIFQEHYMYLLLGS